MLKRPKERMDNISGGGGGVGLVFKYLWAIHFCKPETVLYNWIRKESTLMFKRKLKSEIHMC